MSFALTSLAPTATCFFSTVSRTLIQIKAYQANDELIAGIDLANKNMKTVILKFEQNFIKCFKVRTIDF
jgi:hypothetical protein